MSIRSPTTISIVTAIVIVRMFSATFFNVAPSRAKRSISRNLTAILDSNSRIRFMALPNLI